jgi:hypothetical protein
MSFKPVYFNQVEQIINSLMNKVSYSLDNLSNIDLKAISKQISLPMSHLINLSISLSPRTARVIGGLDSSDIFCNSDYKHFLA